MTSVDAVARFARTRQGGVKVACRSSLHSSPPVLPIRDRRRQATCSSIGVTWLTGGARRVMAIAFGCGVGELENDDVRMTKDG